MTPNDDTGLLKGYDIDALRRKIRSAPFATIYDALSEAAYKAIDADLESDVIVSRGWCHSQYFTSRVMEAAFVYRMTGDPRAAAHVARQIDKLDRVYADMPHSFAREIPGFAGRPTAYFSNAHTALAAVMCRDGLPDSSYQKLCRLARKHLIADAGDPAYFFTHWNAGHNAVITHAIAAAIVAMTLGHEVGHPETDKFIAFGRDACEMHAHWSHDEEGSPYEGPMYAMVTLEWVFLFADLLKRHGGEDLFATLPKFKAIAQAAAEMQLPGFVGISGFEDSRSLINQQMMPWLLLTAREYRREQDLALWWDTARAPDPTLLHQAQNKAWTGLFDLLWWDGMLPKKHISKHEMPTAFFGRGTAVGVMRTSWNDDAVCLYVLGQGRSVNVPDHTHADAGHFSIYAYGDYLAYDTAYFNFDEDTHSVVLIDDKPHWPTVRGNLYPGRFDAVQRHAMLDFVSVDAAAAKGCMWATRQVLFIRGEGDFAYTVVLDKINVDVKVHNYKWQLQANMNTRIEVGGEREASVIGGKARLDCTFFNTLPGDFPTCPHTMKVYADQHAHMNVWSKKLETNPRLICEQTGPNCTIMAVIIPRRIDEPRIRVTDATAYRTGVAYVEHGSWIDQIIFASDHIHVRLPQVHASSEVIVIRRDRSGKVIDTWTIDGKPVRHVQ